MELTEYQHRFEHAVLERRDGILEIRLHSDGGPLQWGLGPHRELPDLFAAVASDYANRVVILTGTGNVFSGPVASSASTSSIPYRLPLAAADRILWEGKQLLQRARALATELASRSDLVLRYSRAMLTEQLKRQMQDLLGYGLALEMLALQDRPAPPAAGGR